LLNFASYITEITEDLYNVPDQAEKRKVWSWFYIVKWIHVWLLNFGYWFCRVDDDNDGLELECEIKL